MSNFEKGEPVPTGLVVPAYVDEAGARGFVRNLRSDQDGDLGVLCALIFDPDNHARAIEAFTPLFERFRAAAPPGAKLHITDAFAPGNSEWRVVAEHVREEYLQLIETYRPMVIYAARRLGVARATYEQQLAQQAAARAERTSLVQVVGENRPSEERVEDDLLQSLVLRLDAFADDMLSQVHEVAQVDLLFDEIDVAKRYEGVIQRTREISGSITTVRGWDPTHEKRVQGTIEITAKAPFRLDTKFIGEIRVVGKADPLVLAVDIVANHLTHHLRTLPANAPLSAPSSIQEWRLAERVWGVMDGATEDFF